MVSAIERFHCMSHMRQFQKSRSRQIVSCNPGMTWHFVWSMIGNWILSLLQAHLSCLTLFSKYSDTSLQGGGRYIEVFFKRTFHFHFKRTFAPDQWNCHIWGVTKDQRPGHKICVCDFIVSWCRDWDGGLSCQNMLKHDRHYIHIYMIVMIVIIYIYIYIWSSWSSLYIYI